MSYQNVNSTFSRVANNIAKMGAYYTDVEHCKSLSTFFEWPEGEEVSVIEPSIGDGSAVFAVTNSENNPNIRIFGVELNDEVADRMKQDERCEAILKADFLSGVRIKNSVFSFCFGNPPYIDDQLSTEDTGRQELSFLQKVTNYLTRDGVIVWVIPHRVFIDDKFIRYWMTRFDTLGVYKFRPDEYKKFGQVALIGRKAKVKVFLKDATLEYKAKYQTIDLIPELPFIYDGEKIKISPSPSDAVTLFGTVEFDPDEARTLLVTKGNELDKVFSTYASTKEFVSSDIGRPPITPKNDSMYLLSVCGVGSGIAGEEGKDLHLQRGIAEVVEDKSTEQVEEGGKTKVVDKITTRTQIKMTLIQSNGQIDHLM